MFPAGEKLKNAGNANTTKISSCIVSLFVVSVVSMVTVRRSGKLNKLNHHKRQRQTAVLVHNSSMAAIMGTAGKHMEDKMSR